MPRKTKYSTEFGATASLALAERRMMQIDLADKVGKSVAYVNATLTGRKPAKAAWVDLVADAMDVTPEKRAEMHRAAARDAGFKLC